VAEIKSALEMALEKAEQFGRATKEELAETRYQEQGRHLAVNFLKGEGGLEEELQGLPPQGRETARRVIKEVLLRNISLPRNGEIEARLDRVVAGLLLVAGNRKAMDRLKAELEQILQNFLQVRHSAFQQLKARYGAGVNQVQRALEAQLRQKVKLDVEQLPQFQEEWRRFLGNLVEQFEPLLEECKAKMLRA
jgi:23S rRNA-/tRNA-specific pseudouridylate synthase